MPERSPPFSTLRVLSGYLLALFLALGGSLVASVLSIAPRGAGRERIGRNLVGAISRAFVGWLRFIRAVETDLETLVQLRDRRGEIIAPNHPSLIDAIILFAALPQAFCLVKAGVMRNPLLGPMAHLAGFVSNDAGAAVVGECADRLRRGEILVIFPEGSRTVVPPLNALQPGFALIARRAAAPIQTLLVRQNRPFLGKRGPFVRLDVALPITYEFALGPRFEPGSFGRARDLSAHVERALRNALQPAG